MPERPLFPSGYDAEPIPRTPIRPLGMVSDFVVDVLPSYLADIRAGKRSATELSDAADVFVGSTRINWDELNGDDKIRDIALLDLILLRQGIIRAEGAMPPNLQKEVRLGAAMSRRIPALTYEDLVMVNPLGKDPRLLTTGDESKTELDFYETHARIEADLAQVISSMVKSITALGDTNIAPTARVAEATTLLTDAFRGIPSSHAAHTLGGIGKDMQVPHFNLFNAYFQPDPDGYRAPSGLFTTTIPCIELLLAGENVLPSTEDEIEKSMDYYPRAGKAKLRFAQELNTHGVSLLSLTQAVGNPPDLYAQLQRAENYLRSFRRSHLKAVINKAPDAYSGDRAGTAGVMDVKNFLEVRIDQVLIPDLEQPN